MKYPDLKLEKIGETIKYLGNPVRLTEVFMGSRLRFPDSPTAYIRVQGNSKKKTSWHTLGMNDGVVSREDFKIVEANYRRWKKKEETK